MWDKDGVKQISPTGRQSPHTHNDSLNHPSHFSERVYGISATQVHIHLSPTWLELSISFIDSWNTLGWKGCWRPAEPLQFAAQRELFQGWQQRIINSSEAKQTVNSIGDCIDHGSKLHSWHQRDTKTILKKIHRERMTTGHKIAVYESKCKM